MSMHTCYFKERINRRFVPDLVSRDSVVGVDARVAPAGGDVLAAGDGAQRVLHLVAVHVARGRRRERLVAVLKLVPVDVQIEL